jgi:hypothetical protein
VVIARQEMNQAVQLELLQPSECAHAGKQAHKGFRVHLQGCQRRRRRQSYKRHVAPLVLEKVECQGLEYGHRFPEDRARMVLRNEVDLGNG